MVKVMPSYTVVKSCWFYFQLIQIWYMLADNIKPENKTNRRLNITARDLVFSAATS